MNGLEVPADIAVTGGEYAINCENQWSSAAGKIYPQQSVCVRHTSSSQGNATVTTTLTIHTLSVSFSSTTKAAAASPPPPSSSASGGGGGGALDYLTLIYMSLLGALGIIARRPRAR